jgi:hypothetical protein
MGNVSKKRFHASYTTTRITKSQTCEQFFVFQVLFLFCKFTFYYVVCASYLSWDLNYFKNLQNKGLRGVLMFQDNGCFSCGVMIVFPKAQHAIHLNCIVFDMRLSLFYHSAMLQSLLAIINFPSDLRSTFQTATIHETSVLQIHICRLAQNSSWQNN